MDEDRVLDAREVPLGGLRALTVHRTLPHRDRPTIGAWCFVDHFGPTAESMSVLPHPHTGLQTVTWPIEGDIRHRDSLGNDVVLRPAELNLMTSGDGISHSEFSVGDPDAPMHGVQLWVALPQEARFVSPGFEHLPDLPRVEGDGWSGIVLVGSFGGAESPARTYSPLVGVQLAVGPGTVRLPVRPEFEHGVLAVDSDVGIGSRVIAHRQLQYLAPGRHEVELVVERRTTVLLIGGVPFDEELVMWWNFIGRSHEDIEEARRDWQAAAPRFGHVDGHGGQVIPAPELPHTRLRPRRRRS